MSMDVCFMRHRAGTDGRTDRRYQMYYLPRYAVDSDHDETSSEQLPTKHC